MPKGWTIGALENRKTPVWLVVPIVAIVAMFANLICLGKRLLLPAGFGAHLLFNASGFWFRLCSYALFGLAAGLIAAVAACLLERGRRRPR